MGNRRKSREVALQALYQAEVCADDPMDHFALLCQNFEVDKRAISYAQALIEGVGIHGAEIDSLITRNAKNWRVGRMSIIDRNLIRIGVFEVMFRDDVPATVAINEAIEIAKRYSTDDAPSFINGILDAITNGQSQ